MKVIALTLALAATANAVSTVTVHSSDPHHIHATFHAHGLEYKKLFKEHEGVPAYAMRIVDTDTKEVLLEAWGEDGQEYVGSSLHRGESIDVLHKFHMHPKVANLPEIAFQLGAEGINGKDHPAALHLYTLAEMQYELNERIGDSEMKAEENIASTEGLLEVLEEGEEGWYRRRRRRRRRRGGNVNDGAAGIIDIAAIHRQNMGGWNWCTNACFGECGPACNCWPFVCGDSAAPEYDEHTTTHTSAGTVVTTGTGGGWCRGAPGTGLGNHVLHRGCIEHDCWTSCETHDETTEWGVNDSTNAWFRGNLVKASKISCNSLLCATGFCQTDRAYFGPECSNPGAPWDNPCNLEDNNMSPSGFSTAMRACLTSIGAKHSNQSALPGRDTMTMSLGSAAYEAICDTRSWRDGSFCNISEFHEVWG